MRLMSLIFYNDEKVLDMYDQFMFGDEFMIAPALNENIDYLNVYIPLE
jgi:alpha-glucosidase (family GH31 glycosyl hydrolase)